MIEPKIKQLRLSNDDEIICEIMQEAELGEAGVLIRSCMKVVVVEDFSRGVRFYAFRPFFSFVDEPMDMHVLNSNHIIAETSPSTHMLSHYAKSIAGMREDKKVKEFDFEDVAKQMGGNLEDITDEDFEEFLENMEDDTDSDDGNGNVIRFPKFDKNKLH